MKLEKDILFLTIKRKWFDKILSGEKSIEYRDVKKYYIDKFTEPLKYSKILLQAGYSKNSPRLIADIEKIQIENVCIETNLFEFSNNYFCIYLKNVEKI